MDETTEQAAPETQATAEETNTPEQTLSAHDRCDAKDCGARAYVKVSLESGDLHFCGHDYAKREELLKAVNAQVLDERSFLLQR